MTGFLPWGGLALATVAFALLLTFLASGLTPLSVQGRALQRKVFHAGIFTGALPAQLLMGFWGVVLYGTVLSSLIFLAVVRGRRSTLFQVLSREKEGEDRPALLLPLGATAVGGLLTLVLVGDFAMVGYLVCGWGDAAGEVVGRRLGKTPWSRILPRGLGGQRTLEGSAAVLVMGSLGGWAALGVLGHGTLQALAGGLAAGAAGVVGELLGWRGSDNLWVQLLPALTAWWLLG